MVPDLADARIIPTFVGGYDRTELFVCSKMTLFGKSEVSIYS